MNAIPAPQPSKYKPQFVDLVTSPNAADTDIPDHARYFEIIRYADDYCSPYYCASNAPNKASGWLRLGTAVSGRHDGGIFQDHEVRADIWTNANLTFFEQDYLVVDMYGFAIGRRVTSSHAQIRLFVLGQEIAFHNDVGPNALVAPWLLEFIDEPLYVETVDVDFDYNFWSFSFETLVSYRLLGSVIYLGELHADADDAIISPDGLKISLDIDVDAEVSKNWSIQNPDWSIFVIPPGSLDAFTLQKSPDISVQRRELALDLTRYSYDVELDTCIGVLTGDVYLDWLGIWHGDLVAGPSEPLLDPAETLSTPTCGQWLSELGVEFVGSSAELSSGAAATEQNPAFWRPGSEYLYTIAYRSKLQKSAGESPVEREIVGELTVAPIITDPEGHTIVRMALVGPRTGSPDADAALADDFATPFYIAINRSGGIDRVWLLPGLSPEAEYFLRLLAGEFQFVRAGAKQETWTVIERDLRGQFDAVYQRLSPYNYRKDMQNFRQTQTSQRSTNEMRITKGSHIVDYQFDVDNQLVSIASEMTSQVSLLNNNQLTSTEEFRATRRTVRVASRCPRLPDRRLKGFSRVMRADVAEVDNSGAHKGSVEDSYDVLIAALKRTAETDLKDQSFNRLGKQLVALFRQYPREIARVRDDIHMLDEKSGAVLVAAMAATEHKEAEAVLCALAMNTDLAESVRAAAVRGLVRNAPPSAAALDVLLKLADGTDSPVHRQVMLTLGTAANRMSEPASRYRLVDDIIERFKEATELEERLLFLATLGNTGSSRIVPLIDAVMDDDDHLIRAFAVSALRLVAGAQAEGLILTALRGDVHPEVRRSALMAARYREPAAYLDALSYVLQQDSSAAVRHAALQLLHDWQYTGLPVSELVRWVADHDSDTEIRKLAQRILVSVNLR